MRAIRAIPTCQFQLLVCMTLSFIHRKLSTEPLFRLTEAIRVIRGEPPAKNAMFGFPYLDTLKLLRRPELSVGVDFYAHGDQQSGDYDALQRSLAVDALQGIFFESPTNPLLKVPEVPIGARVSAGSLRGGRSIV